MSTFSPPPHRFDDEHRTRVISSRTTQPPQFVGGSQKIYRLPVDPRLSPQGRYVQIALDGLGCGMRGCTRHPAHFVVVSDGTLTLATELSPQQAQRLRLLGSLDLMGAPDPGQAASTRFIRIQVRGGTPDLASQIVFRDGVQTGVYVLSEQQAHQLRFTHGRLFTRPIPQHR